MLFRINRKNFSSKVSCKSFCIFSQLCSHRQQCFYYHSDSRMCSNSFKCCFHWFNGKSLIHHPHTNSESPQTNFSDYALTKRHQKLYHLLHSQITRRRVRSDNFNLILKYYLISELTRKKNIFYVNKAYSHHYVHISALAAQWAPADLQYSPHSRLYIALLISVDIVL